MPLNGCDQVECAPSADNPNWWNQCEPIIGAIEGLGYSRPYACESASLETNGSCPHHCFPMGILVDEHGVGNWRFPFGLVQPSPPPANAPPPPPSPHPDVTKRILPPVVAALIVLGVCILTLAGLSGCGIECSSLGTPKEAKYTPTSE